MLGASETVEPNPPIKMITVFGGTGFLGRRVVRHLLRTGFMVRVASRHPEHGEDLFGTHSRVLNVHADIEDGTTLAPALEGSWGAVNAVSLYVERGETTFHSVHVEAAALLARRARNHGLRRLLHVSGIGSSLHSSSPYIRSRGRGELEVCKAFAEANIIRPAVMFGADDKLLVPLIGLLGSLPVFPMFGRGKTKLQPAHVEDVGEAIARIANMPDASPIYELGGPEVLTYRQLLAKLKVEMGFKTPLVPVPFAAWRLLASAAELLPQPPVTTNQIELMGEDNIAWSGPRFQTLGIVPTAIDSVIAEIAEAS